MFLKIILLTLTLHLVEVNPSLVFDTMYQDSLYVDEYCPEMPHCKEGTHVMCMSYDPHKAFGSHCSNAMTNVTMNSDLATKLIEIVNAIRGKVAMGIETGKNGVALPRAYGMPKLQWDNELATFAQVTARRCLLRKDECRATKRFPQPGQLLTKIRFTIPDWQPITSQKITSKPGLTVTKILHAITNVMKTWYKGKANVTPNMIVKDPDFSHSLTLYYLTLVNSKLTHMGCGISAFSDYAFNDIRAKLSFNVILVVCNFSTQPLKNTMVYPTTPAHDTRCGCSAKAKEDENCLCISIDVPKKAQKSGGDARGNQFAGDAVKWVPFLREHCEGVHCNPPLIVLPIFTVEDAPPSKLIGKQRAVRQRYDKRSSGILPTQSLEVEHLDYLKNISHNEPTIAKALNGIRNMDNLEKNGVKPLRASVTRPSGKPVATLSDKQSPASVPGLSAAGSRRSRKTSIFLRSKILGTSKGLKKDVVPRKDFTKSKHPTNLQHRLNLPEQRKINIIPTTEGNLNHAKELAIIYHYKNDTSHSKNVKKYKRKDSGGTKLLALLDKLENEVKHIQLKGNKKEIFDAKIRKIYDSVVGKSSKPETDDKVYDDIDNTMIDYVGHYHRESTNRNNLEEDNDSTKNRRKMKNQLDVPYYSDRHIVSNYEILPRDRADPNLQTDHLFSVYTDSNNEYKPYRFLDHKQSCNKKYQDHPYEIIEKRRFSNNERISRDKRIKHSRDYSKNRNTHRAERFNNYYRMHQAKEDIDNGVLSRERRKLYQERLENIERKLHSTRNYKYRTEDDHRRRSMLLPSSNEAPRRPSKNHLEHFDMRTRSRFLHGY